MIIAIIVAASENQVIGKDNAIPWYLPDDFRYFKRRTLGHHIIMGRKTFESIGSKPLKGRTNIVITRQDDYSPKGVIVFHSLGEALDYTRNSDEKEAFVIGGSSLIKKVLPITDKIYLTEVKATVDGDVIMPDIKRSQWREIIRCPHPADEKHEYAFDFVELGRKI